MRPMLFLQMSFLRNNFILNSLTIDGTTQVGANPANGVNIGSIPTGTTKNVSFQVVVNTIPPSNVVSNGSSASYQYTVNPSQLPVTKTFLLISFPLKLTMPI